MFTRVVRVVEVIAVCAFAAMIVLLFVREPSAQTTSGPPDGAALYAGNCASCHGAKGEGGIGTKLGGGAVVRSLTEDQEIFIVERGLSGLGMPAFEQRLTREQIAAIVAFTRTELDKQ